MRQLWFLPLSALVVFMLFSFMAQLAGFGLTHEYSRQESLSIDIGRMRFDTDLNIRERLRPPPPLLESQSTPEPKVATPKQAVAAGMPDISPSVAPLDLDIKMNIGADLSKIAISDLQLSDSLELNLTQAPITRINPMYPRRALQRGIEGEVTAEFTVDPEGQVVPDSFKIIDATPPGVFDNVVKRAILRWKFNPFVKNGKSQPFRTRQKLSFKMQS
ncbi:energy transducer TonB [Alkalimarinus coralli]|uniref:energy transducer TonB n=1 Tax=Alkalimarinus coralli TaxID=2935863 RepID=UPI00202B9E22|nr:energy transducer TonB [Alkalimarinus coralli]